MSHTIIGANMSNATAQRVYGEITNQDCVLHGTTKPPKPKKVKRRNDRNAIKTPA